MKSYKIQLTFKSIHCVKKGLLVCWSAASRMCFSLAIISSLLTFQFVSGAADDCESIKNPVLFITTPENLEGLSGSCLQVPCHFSAKERASFSGQNFGVWIKSDSRFKEFSRNVIFNSSGSIKTYPLEITGNLERQNCTTVFRSLTREHSDTYFFRIERTQFQATASCSGFRLTVRDSPWSPSINLPSDLKEHQSVTVTCSAFTPCPQSPPELTWNLQQDSLRQTEKNTDGTFTTKIQENITLSDTHDGYNIRCSARYPVIGGNKTAETEVTLSVSYAPRNTSASIRPSGLVSAGSWVELSCFSRAKPPPSFTWFRNSTNGAMNVSVGPVYFNATEGEEYYCVATNDLGTNRSPVILVTNKAFPLWIAILASIIVILLICLVICVWCKFKHPTPRQTQTQTETEVQMSDRKPDEEIHYGEVSFLPRRPEASAVSVQDSGQQELVYASVKGSADRSEDLYAHVKKN